MGLAGAFGDQQFRCKACGHSTALYSPHCPSCLGKTLSRVQADKMPGPSETSANNPLNQTEEGPRAGLSFPLIAVVIGLIVVVYSFVFAPKQDASKPDTQTEAAPKPESHPVRVVRQHPRPHPVAAQPGRAHIGSSPRKAPPMKLWSVSSDE
jgi:hypothetical protein